MWAYNTGYYPYANRASNGGHYGVGWANNPANNIYRPNRQGFMRGDLADAETPGQWSYPERIMGWIETPQYKDSPAYSEPTYGDNAPTYNRLSWRDIDPIHKGISIPGLYTFCSTSLNPSEGVDPS